MSYGRGHVKGTKRERTGSQDWYAVHAEANIARIEAAEQAQGAIADMQRALAAIEGMRKVLAVKQAAHEHTVAVATAAKAVVEAEEQA